MSQNHPDHLERENETGQHYKGKEKPQSQNPTLLTALRKWTEWPVTSPKLWRHRRSPRSSGLLGPPPPPYGAGHIMMLCFHVHFLETLINSKKTISPFFPWKSGPLGHGEHKRWPTHKKQLLLPLWRPDQGLRKDCRWRGTWERTQKTSRVISERIFWF